MAVILTLAAGALGFISGLIALAIGSSLLTAFLIWTGISITATAIGLFCLISPRGLNFRTQS